MAWPTPVQDGAQDLISEQDMKIKIPKNIITLPAPPASFQPALWPCHLHQAAPQTGLQSVLCIGAPASEDLESPNPSPVPRSLVQICFCPKGLTFSNSECHGRLPSGTRTLETIHSLVFFWGHSV